METIQLESTLRNLFHDHITNVFKRISDTPKHISKFSVGYSGGMWAFGNETAAFNLKVCADQFLERYFKNKNTSMPESRFCLGFLVTKKKCPSLVCDEATVRVWMDLADTTKPAHIDVIWTTGKQKIDAQKVWLSIPEETRSFILTASEISGTYVISKVIDYLAPFDWIDAAYEINSVLKKLPKKINS